ncbi:MAG: FKBP-type peptidyl-prolyl cis-trans isomerase [Nanoarchaeota archaeon]|nr:FKBP-type peptidyl-prolyl cis-trans isomerase [Nanoarchaeota archaeon]
MSENITVKKKDFIEIKYTGLANGEIFDSNIPEDLKKINEKAEPKKTIVAIGEGMVVYGLDKELLDKEIGKDYEIKVPYSEAFGPRKRELIKTIPLSAFTENKVMPRPGMVLTLDNYLVKILTVSGARVIVDFNNPLAGKDLLYKLTIVQKVNDEKEKCIALFDFFFRFSPEFEIKEKSVIVKGPKNMGLFVNAYKEKFKELIGKELEFEEIKPKKKHSDIEQPQK